MLMVEMCAQMKKKNPDYELPQILDFINDIQNRMLSHAIKTREVFVNGEHPTITMVDGVFLYPIGDAIRVASVYTCDPLYPVEYMIIPSTATKSLEVQVLKDYSGDLKVKYYKKPVKASIGVELEIPEEYHYNTVIKGVQGLIDEDENGDNTSHAMNDFDERRLPKFWGDMNFDASPKANIRRGYK
jgi:hypothetical protein